MTALQRLEQHTRKNAMRKRVLDSSLELVASGGFAALTVAAVANKAGMSIGAIYNHFDSKDHLDVSTYTLAAETEVGHVRDVVAGPGLASERLARGIAVAVTRAIDHHKLAFALSEEQVGQVVDARRAAYRQAYSSIFQGVINEGVQAREFAQQDASVTGIAILGAIRDSLSATWHLPESEVHTRTQQLITAVQGFCLGAVMYPM